MVQSVVEQETIHDPAHAGPDSLAERTLACCRAWRVQPTPAIYAVVFTYLAGTHAGIADAIRDRIASGGAVTGAFLSAMHARYLAPQSRPRAEPRPVCGRSGLAEGPPPPFARSPGPKGRDAAQLAAGSLRRRLAQLEREVAALRRCAHVDHLTQLANRRSFDAILRGLFRHAHAGAAPLACILVDIDRFKSINDRFGHATGDSILRSYAGTIRHLVGEAGFAARYGGEEFCILLPGAGLAEAVRLADTIRRRFGGFDWTTWGEGRPVGTVTASFGVAVRRRADTPDSLLARADALLYRAKAAGRDRVVGDDARLPD